MFQPGREAEMFSLVEDKTAEGREGGGTVSRVHSLSHSWRWMAVTLPSLSASDKPPCLRPRVVGPYNGIALIRVALVHQPLPPAKEDPLCELNELGD